MGNFLFLHVAVNCPFQIATLGRCSGLLVNDERYHGNHEQSPTNPTNLYTNINHKEILNVK